MPVPQSASGDVIVVLGGGSLADVPLPQGWSGQVTDGPAQRLAGGPVRRRGVSRQWCGGADHAGCAGESGDGT